LSGWVFSKFNQFSPLNYSMGFVRHPFFWPCFAIFIAQSEITV